MLHHIGGSFCHQLTERSFIVAEQLPVCARCTGSMIGVFCGALFLIVFKRANGNKPFNLIPLIAMVVGFVAFAFDGISSYVGLRETNNVIRLITGLSIGYSFPMFFTLMRNFKVEQKNDIPILKVRDLVTIFFLMTLASALILIKNIAVWYTLSVIITLGIFYFYMNLSRFAIDFIEWVFRRNIKIKIQLSAAMAILIMIIVPQMMSYIKE